jgi:5'-AMP-activated protein kinase regulatory beta subunit
LAPDARHVSLVGSFNTWDTKKHLMRKNSKGEWQKTVVLEPGTYEYKFWVDGEWVIDKSNDNRCANPFGTMNSFVTVSPWKK